MSGSCVVARRADYALGKAIRDGQDNGTVASRGSHRGNQYSSGNTALPEISKVSSLASNAELYGDKRGNGGNGILALADNASPAEFETALTEAKVEGNLSRADYVVVGRIVCYKCSHCNDYFS